tara:strand:- start:331 stop:756 length:426 start_codon:yes stop_codon:yes gene_type:complete
MPRNLAPDIEQMRSDVLRKIDEQAGSTRSFFVSPGALVDAEYMQAQRAVERWRTAGEPEDDVPDEIVSGAEYGDLTYAEAADEIEQTARQFDAVLAAIRRVRLTHKRAAREAQTSTALAQARRSAVAAYAQIRDDYAALAG